MYKRPESVLVVVITQAAEVLVLRRTEPADFWQSVTGSLRWGESPRRAALRELREETGLVGGLNLIDARHRERFPIVPPWRARYAPWARYNTEHWFYLLMPGRRLIRLNPKEHVEYRWLPAGPAARTMSSWTNRDAILAWPDRIRQATEDRLGGDVLRGYAGGICWGGGCLGLPAPAVPR
jgi:dihydroneopterin triphosphate diphosphatase